MVGWCKPVSSRFQRLLRATESAPPGRAYAADRYACAERLEGRSVLLVDDTWATGGHAQSAATALHQAGAGSIGFVVLGRHVQPEWEPVAGESNADRLGALPRAFSWETCAVH